MISSRLSDTLASIENMVNTQFDQTMLAEWIQTHTVINNRPFSFKNHEYQERIIQSEARERYVRKCSQVGISEMSARLSLAYADTVRGGFDQIYTLPTHKFAEKFSKTRVDTIISESKRLKSRLTMDSSSIKRISKNFVYYSGTFGDNAAISVPADMLWHDEVDFSDQTVLEKFNSRLTHSNYKMKFGLSTPTVTGYGIDLMFTNSRRFFQHCKCNHCNHWFIPDYFEHVRVPDYDGDLLMITKAMLAEISWREAALHCPKCGKTPNLSPDYRNWVCENPWDTGFEAEGFQVSPFDAPAVITPSYLVHRSTQYALKRDFINFNLGLPYNDSTSGLMPEDFEMMENVGRESHYGEYFVGVDMGDTCHAVITKGSKDHKRLIVYRYQVNMRYIEQFMDYIQAVFRPVAVVMDAMPYTETVYRFQQKWPNVYGAFYRNSLSLETSQVRDRIEDEEKSSEDLRQVNINRDQAFDVLMEDIRRGLIGIVHLQRPVPTLSGSISSDTDWEVFKKQLTEMKRILQEPKSAFTAPKYHWQKPPNADDHYHHALLYAETAVGITGATSARRGGLPPMMGKVRNKGSL